VHSYTGIIAGTATQDYKNGLLKKHEDTLQPREQLFKEYLKTAGFNAEPVLLTYPDDDLVNTIIDSQKKSRPVYDFVTTDHSNHKLWVVNDPVAIKSLQDQFKKMPHIYIADGHHRSASSSLLAGEMGENHDSYNYFMSYLIAQSQLRIYEFNRLVKDLNGLSKEDFLMQLDMKFRIQNRGLEMYKPSYGQTDLLRIKDRVDKGEFTVGFGLFPATVEQLKSIADASMIMPPKSTYIRPKLPSGLTIYEFES